MILNQFSDFLKKVIHARLDMEFNGKKHDLPEFTMPSKSVNNKLTEFIVQEKLSEAEIIVVLLALIPHLSPHFFSSIIAQFLPNGGDFPEFGGVKGQHHRGILPTGETVLYVLAGRSIEKRLWAANLFDEEHLFARKNVLSLEAVPQGEPRMSGRLILDEEYVDWFISGRIKPPKLSSNFPAQRIVTDMNWSDLVLPDETLSEIKEIETWIKYNARFVKDWNMEGKVKPGYRVMFHGPPGTGKTLTACLLGKYTEREVFRIDLSLVVSKYIGETEKNLSKLFDKASNKNWILFFDEADSIFGKRTNVRDAHDKYANQEVSYLLQRIEAHPGLVILATNMKGNIDSSFTRRFNSLVEFKNPDPQQRLSLWENYLPKSVPLDASVELRELAKNFELSGANIVNAIHYAGLQTLQKKNTSISSIDLQTGIEREYQKEGKIIRRS